MIMLWRRGWDSKKPTSRLSLGLYLGANAGATLLLVFVASCAVYAQEPEPIPPVRDSVKIGLVLLGAGTVLDLHSTHVCTAIGCSERNPIMRGGTPSRIAISSAGFAGYTWLATSKWGRKHPKLVTVATWTAVAITGAVVASNYRFYVQGRAKGCTPVAPCLHPE